MAQSKLAGTSLLARLLSLDPNPRPNDSHFVLFTSSTLGSLDLNSKEEEMKKQGNGDDREIELPIELDNARAWSNVIGRKIPKTPVETPPNEPESIDALELMAGFHGDYSPLDRRSFAFCPIGHLDPTPRSKPESCSSCIVEEKGDSVIFYFTSLRGIRKTYDDCCLVKNILKEYRICMDERDVSMHGEFKEELKQMSRECSFTLPMVFVDGRELGGAKEIKRMHEAGELGEVFQGCRVEMRRKEEEEETGEAYCQVCGDVRFVMCVNCSGSCRVFSDEDDEWRRCSSCNENGIVRCPVCC